MKNVFSKGMFGSLVAVSLMTSVAVNAGPLPVQDNGMSIVIDKSLIHGDLVQNPAGNLVYDGAGNARFAYSGTIHAIETDGAGNATGMSAAIGNIEGEAAFPKEFVALSAGVNALMGSMMAGTWDGVMPKFPSIVPWTCNKCDIVMNDGRHYISIVDALDPASPYYNAAMVAQLDNALADGAAGALDSMRMKGRAFTGVGPTVFDPANRKMGVRMAGCSALLEITQGKIGTLCMNATAIFDVSGAIARFNPMGQQVGYLPSSSISADGSSNCVTVMQPIQ